MPVHGYVCRAFALPSHHEGHFGELRGALGKARMQVQRWLRRHALDPARFRG